MDLHPPLGKRLHVHVVDFMNWKDKENKRRAVCERRHTEEEYIWNTPNMTFPSGAGAKPVR